jgi:hypothetical protein
VGAQNVGAWDWLFKKYIFKYNNNYIVTIIINQDLFKTFTCTCNELHIVDKNHRPRILQKQFGEY